MKLFDVFNRGGGARGFHTAIVTTFGVDFGAFEHVLLPQFEGAGATNIVLMGDERMLALAANEGAMRPLRAGAHYLVHPVRTPKGGVFHSKIALQLGRQGARLIVGSANATGPGLGGNRELVAELKCDDKQSADQIIVTQVWRYLEQLADQGEHAELAREALAWARARTPWLARIEAAPSPVALSDGTQSAFLAEAGDGAPSIMARFMDLIGEGPIDQLVIMSPYWDDGLDACRELISRLSPTRTQILIQPRQTLFPTHALGLLNADLYDVDAGDAQVRRFTHAKLIIARRSGVDHVLIGSANCTRAALGRADGSGAINGEACLYRALPAGLVERQLELSALLAAAPLAAGALKPQDLGEDIPLAETAARLPGAFQLDGARLRWRPSAAFKGAAIQLLDKNGGVIGEVASASWRQTADHWLQCDLDIDGEAIRFARALSPSGISLDAIVVHSAHLAGRRKERATQKAARASALLEDLDEFDLTMLEAMAELEREDERDDGAGARRPRSKPADDSEDGQSLSYEDFIKARDPRADAKQRARNTLAGQNIDSVRAALNRILFDEDDSKLFDLDPHDLSDDLGETNEDCGDGGGPPPGPPPRHRAGSIQELATRSFDPHDYAHAVRAFRETLAARAKAGAIRSREALRLRLLLMILLGKADAPLAPFGARKLACDDSDTGWPRLVLILCAGFFHDSPSPIAVMAMDERYETLPDDLLEAWATSIWALALAQHCLKRARPEARLLAHFPRLIDEVRAKSGLRRTDLESAHGRRVLDRLGQIYQPRLGVKQLTINASP